MADTSAVRTGRPLIVGDVRASELPADDLGVVAIEVIVTHGAPHAVEENLDTALERIGAVDESNGSSCRGRRRRRRCSRSTFHAGILPVTAVVTPRIRASVETAISQS